jgi:DNA-binding XRE family transcriptional regulator
MKYVDLSDRLIKNAVAEPIEGCWRWQQNVNTNGYGRINVAGKTTGVHRLSYETFQGPIPTGMHIDHLCHTWAAQAGKCAGGKTCMHRRCINPAHLEAVAPIVNVYRSPFTFGRVNGLKTACDSGHELDGPNVGYSTNEYGRQRRYCRTCKRKRTLAYYHQGSKGKGKSRKVHPSEHGVLDGEALRGARISAGLTQSDLVRAIPGLTRNIASRLELNQARPSDEVLHAIAAALHVDVRSLLYSALTHGRDAA